MSTLPPPRDLEAPVGELVVELAGHLGERSTVDLCVELLEGAERDEHRAAMPYFTGLVFEEGSPTTDPKHWKDYWVRTWGARGLLYVWDDSAAPAFWVAIMRSAETFLNSPGFSIPWMAILTSANSVGFRLQAGGSESRSAGTSS